MKTKKMVVRLFPDPGRVIVGAFVFVNRQITIAEEVTPTTVTVKLGGEFVEFPSNAVKLAKFFAFNIKKNRLVGEIAYKDYDKVKDGIIIIGEIFPKVSPIEVGDKVRIDRPCLKDFAECERNGFEGIISRCTSRLFTISLADTSIDLHRSQFKLISKPNYRNIIKVVETINN